MICGEDNSAGEKFFSGCWWKVFEYFQNIDEREVEESFASGK